MYAAQHSRDVFHNCSLECLICTFFELQIHHSSSLHYFGFLSCSLDSSSPSFVRNS